MNTQNETNLDGSRAGDSQGDSGFSFVTVRLSRGDVFLSLLKQNADIRRKVTDMILAGNATDLVESDLSSLLEIWTKGYDAEMEGDTSSGLPGPQQGPFFETEFKQLTTILTAAGLKFEVQTGALAANRREKHEKEERIRIRVERSKTTRGSLENLKESLVQMSDQVGPLYETVLKGLVASAILNARWMCQQLPEEVRHQLQKDGLLPNEAAHLPRGAQIKYLRSMVPVFEKHFAQTKRSNIQNSDFQKYHGFLFSAAFWCGFLAFSDFQSEWPYQLSRWALCAIALWVGLKLWNQGMRLGLIPLAVAAVAFNPLAPIYFSEDEWKVVDWIGAFVFLGYVPKLSRAVLNTPRILWRCLQTTKV